MDTYFRYRLGVAAFERRDYRGAIDHFEQVLVEDPGALEVREYLARTHYHRAALKAAEREARALLESDPTNEYVTMLLARSLERQSRPEEAELVRRRLAALSGVDEHLAGHTVFA
ncbi:tetratricopeptide repeat protein [Luteococcus peritonei]|uniref:Tetratricopeptide repeat protein n=1 Tax=Luteococcus peritonei TaxID=88874 RepID=A0ABW4RXZ3_9ACTN